MKRLVIFFVLPLFFCFPFFAQVNASFLSFDFLHKVKGEVFFDSQRSFSPFANTNQVTPSFSLSYNVQTQEAFLELGARFSQHTNDISAQLIYWPKFFDCLNIGLGAIYHKKEYDDIFREQDFLFGLFSKYTHKSFTLKSDFDLMKKWAKIEDIDISHLENNSFAVSTMCSWLLFKDSFDFHFGISSYSQFTYKLFFCPQFITGCSHKIGRMWAGFDFMIEYIDMEMLSAYCDDIQIKLYLEWKSK